MSKLARSEICQKCAKCCQEFAMGTFDESEALRFKLLEHPRIIVEERKNFDGHLSWVIHFKIKCSKLKYDKENEKHYCDIYGDERPMM